MSLIYASFYFLKINPVRELRSFTPLEKNFLTGPTVVLNHRQLQKVMTAD